MCNTCVLSIKNYLRLYIYFGRYQIQFVNIAKSANPLLAIYLTCNAEEFSIVQICLAEISQTTCYIRIASKIVENLVYNYSYEILEKEMKVFDANFCSMRFTSRKTKATNGDEYTDVQDKNEQIT